MLNLSKLLKAINDVLSDAGINKIIHRVLPENPELPVIYIDSSEDNITHLKVSSTYRETEFQVKIQDQTTDFKDVEKLVEDFVKALDLKEDLINQKLNQNQAGFELILLRISAVGQNYNPLKDSTIGCIFTIGFNIQFNG